MQENIRKKLITVKQQLKLAKLRKTANTEKTVTQNENEQNKLKAKCRKIITN